MDPTKTSSPQESKLHFLDYWRIIRIRKTVILSVFLLVVITATLVTFILPQSFSSTTRIRVDRNVADISPLLNQQGYAQGSYDPYFIQTEFEVIQSEVVLGQVVDKMHLAEEWGKKYGGQKISHTEAMERLKQNIYLSPVRNTSIIEIRVYSDKPDDARDIANEIAETYKLYRQSQSTNQMMAGINALLDRLHLQEQEVHTAQTNVDYLRRTLQIHEVDPMSFAPTPTLSADALRQLQAQSILLKDKEINEAKQLEHLKKLDRAEMREAIQTALGQPDAYLASLRSDLILAQQRLVALGSEMKPGQPSYDSAKQQVEELDSHINKAVDGILLGLENGLQATKARVAELEQRIESANSNDLYYANLSRPYYEAKQELAEKTQFNQILGMKIASEKTDLDLPRTMVAVIDPAVLNQRAVSPKKTLNIVLGIVIGLVVGIGLAFFIEYLDTSVKTIDDVERTLGSPVLGVIPQNVSFLLEEGAESPHAEAYRVLRTNLLFSRKDENLNSIAVVSAGAGEGKSTTVMNLATIFAQNGNRVVVVDSDLRRPTLHKMLRVTNSIGLTNYLLKQNTLEEVIQTTKLPTLDFLASGKLPSSSLGILSSTQMRELITELKQRYDYVFFDSPPIMGVSDASILASEVDLSLQVIQYRRYPQPMNIRAKQMIEKVGGNLLGIVLNNINMSQDESYYYYSGYYHDYYSKNEEEADSTTRSNGEAEQQAKLDIKSKY